MSAVVEIVPKQVSEEEWKKKEIEQLQLLKYECDTLAMD